MRSNRSRWPSTLHRPVLDRCAARQSACGGLKALRPTLTDGLPTESTLGIYDLQAASARRGKTLRIAARPWNFKLGKAWRTCRPITVPAGQTGIRAFPALHAKNLNKKGVPAPVSGRRGLPARPCPNTVLLPQAEEPIRVFGHARSPGFRAKRRPVRASQLPHFDWNKSQATNPGDNRHRASLRKPVLLLPLYA